VKLLVTSTFVTPFIADDLAILRKRYTVEHLLVRGGGDLPQILLGVSRSDVAYSWFASTYAAAAVAAARSLRKPAVLAIGGADVAGMEDIGYGIWNSPWKARLVGFALRNADRVLAVDPFLKDEAARRAGYDAGNISVLPTGFDAGFWTPGGAERVTVLTVAACESESRLKVKGVELVLETSRLLPDVRFDLVGIGDRFVAGLRARAPQNIEIRGKLSREELREHYRSAAVYFQPSRVEGLPNSVCEAMLCGCIPVCTDVGGMKTPVAGNGFLVPWGDARGLAAAIEQARTLPLDSRIRARESIASRFTPEARERGLVETFEALAR